MAERRIRTAGRPSYGRPLPARGRRRWSLQLSTVQRRALLLVCAALVAVLAGRQVFSIRHIVVVPSGLATRILPEARAVTRSHWTLGNTITFDIESFRSRLLAADPAIKTVNISRQLPSGLKITVTSKQPSLGWVTGNEGYVLDADGTVIGSLPAGSKLPLVLDDSNLPVGAGQDVVSAHFVGFVTGVGAGLPATGLTVTKYEVKDTTFDLYVTTSKGYQLIFDASRTVGDELTDLKVVLANLKQTGKAPTQYIDLRISGRAYYK